MCLEALLDMGDTVVVGAVSADGSGLADLGVPVLGRSDDIDKITLRQSVNALCVAIGDNEARRRISSKLTESGHHVTLAVSRFSMVSSTASIGPGSQLMPGSVVNAASVIGAGVIVNTNASVDHDCLVGEYVHIGPGAVVGGGVSLGATCFVGLGARVLPGLSIGEGAVVGAGAVVITDVAADTTVVGVPARPIRRDGASVTMTQADRFRRLVDVVVGCFGIIVASPVMALSALVIRVTAGRGVIYRQRRLGLAGRPFELLKFRSMRHPRPGREGPEFDNERLTTVGRWLRATSLDELPSLWNLLRGDITLVGPRPLPVHYWDRFVGDEYERFEVRPGITGLAQVSGRNQLDWPERLATDVEYVRTRSLRGDVRILARTVPAVLGRSGVDHAAGVTMHELPVDRSAQPPRRGAGSEA